MRLVSSVVCAAVLSFVAACSTTDGSNPEGPDQGDASGPPARERPRGPAADLSEELSGGNGPFIGAATGFPTPEGYVDHEYVASGMATAYESTGAFTDDGRWTFETTTSAPYRTRVLVRRPQHAARASGTVVVEWLNVSGGVDANPEYASIEEEIIRQGHTWVGVSTQLIGVEGGPILVSVNVTGAGDLAGKGLKSIDPARYGSLQHPGDGYSFDIFTQVGRALLAEKSILGGVAPKALIAAGESQSAFALTTYFDGVQPLTQLFDAFFVHSRGATSLPLVGPGAYADLAGSIVSTSHPILRDDLEIPVVEVQAESDVTGILNSSAARQPDSDYFRLWEVAGTAHADTHLVGPYASQFDCGVPMNDGPMHLVVKAAFRGLEQWLRAAKPPSVGARIELTDEGAATAVRRDADGIAIGGVRTAPVDVPAEVLSGAPGPKPDIICLLLGSTTALPADRLAALYSGRADYQEKYAAASDRTIQAGFVLESDRDTLLAFGRPSLISP